MCVAAAVVFFMMFSYFCIYNDGAIYVPLMKLYYFRAVLCGLIAINPELYKNMLGRTLFITALSLLLLVSCEEKKKDYRPVYNSPSPTFTVGDDEEEDRVTSREREPMESCPFCGGSGNGYGGSVCGFCNGVGEVTATEAAQGRHVMSGGSVSDFYPSGGSSSGSSSQSGPRDRMCPACDGGGRCPVCRGNGEVSNYGNTSICDYCYGQGECPKCMGHGTIPDRP